MCLYPRVIQNKKYTPNKKNGGDVPAVPDERVKYVPIGCGYCMECRRQKARGWKLRLMEEVRENTNGKFVTMTFSNKSIRELWEATGIKKAGYDLDNAIATIGVRRFLERWRKKNGKSVRHWFITELGHQGTENIHLHGIIWTNEKMEEIEKIWEYGHMWKGKEERGGMVNYVNEKTINYLTKYMTKVDPKHKMYIGKILATPGIGRRYTDRMDSNRNKFKGERTDETYKTSTGYKMALPIYYRNKIYSETEREKLWLQKLDKQERWVNGERVDVSKSDREYYKLLEYNRVISREQGYGGNEKIDWTYKQYEEERREIMTKRRVDSSLSKDQQEAWIRSKRSIELEKLELTSRKKG